MPDALSTDQIRQALIDPRIAEHIRVYDTLPSTNDAARAIAPSAVHGTTVLADTQTAGKGRCGHTFVSPPGHGIYMSVILRRPPYDHTLLTVYAAVAVCEAIEATTGLCPGIKWVNDILYHGKKISGILTETVDGALF